MSSALRMTCLVTLIFLGHPASAHILGDSLSRIDGDEPVSLCADPTLVPPDLVSSLLAWIAEETNYDIEGALPEVTFCRTGDTIPYDTGTAVVEPSLRGAYDLAHQRVILVRPWDPKDPRHLGTLLHELVHHVQLSNRTFECLQAPEWEAYKLQEAYLAQKGIDPEFDWLQIYFMSKCPMDIHPD